MFSLNAPKALLIAACVSAASLATPSTAKADLEAVASYGYNWGSATFVGGWVKNSSQLPLDYKQSQGRRVQLWFYYPSSGTWAKVMDQLITDIPHGQERAFQMPINPNIVVEQPLPVLYITPYFTDVNPNNDWSIDTMWLGSF